MRSHLYTLLFITAFFCGSVWAQEKPSDFDEHIILSDSNQITLKSAHATLGSSWTTSTNSKGWRSDYYTYFRWSKLYWHCDCNHKYNIKFYSGGKTYNLGNFTVTSHSKYSADVPLGPSKSGTYTYRADEYGNSDVFLLGCVGSCTGAYWRNTNNRAYSSTARPRTPYSVKCSKGVYDHKILVTWETDTDIPSKYRKYFVYRDGVKVTTVTGTSYTDNNLEPNREYQYRIALNFNGSTASGHTSYQSEVGYGSTFKLNVQASKDISRNVNLTWNNAGGKGKAALTGYKLERFNEDKNAKASIAVPSKDDVELTDFDVPIPGYQYRYILQPEPIASFYPDTAYGGALANGQIKGKIMSPTGHPVPNIKVVAKRSTDVPQGENSEYFAYTDSSGAFEIQEIYYYEEADFVLTPEKEDHGFNPASQSKTLYLGAPRLDGVIFTDTSAFSVSGKVIQIFAGDTCPLPGVDIYLDGNREGTTNATGSFALSVGQIGDYSIKPLLNRHGFMPDSALYSVVSDTIISNFVDTTMFTLSGYMQASCNTYIGQAELRISSGGDAACFDTIVTTESGTGYYALKLPARPYEVSLVSFVSENADVDNTDVETYFAIKEVDLSFEDANLDFIYRNQPTIEIAGFTRYGCGDYENIPIVEQGFRNTLMISVNEVFGDNSCPADTGMILILNNLGAESNKEDTVYISNGMVEYDIFPEEPNLIAPYTKNITFTAFVGTEIVTSSLDIIVEGNKPREQTFATVSPEIPIMVLRDPPGDASYSYLEEGTTSQTSMRISAQTDASLNIWGEVKVGTKFEAGFIGYYTEVEAWGKLKGSLEVGSSISGQEEFQLSITNSNRFSTSGNDDITGEEGDVFAGSALNIIYALTDVIAYDPEKCTVNKSVSLSMGVDGFNTTFIYTETHIRNTLIPQLEQLKMLYESKGNDSALIYANQIDVWRQTLKSNTELKEKAKAYDNISFSSGAMYESSKEVATTKSISYECNLYIESSIAAEAGIEVAGIGASFGTEAKFRFATGLSKTSSVTTTKKTGFVLFDDDQGDAFSVELAEDKAYGTPVFRVVSGRSSCPWEPGTQAREGVQIVSDPYVEYVDDPNGKGVFYLQLGNTSQSDEDKVYNLVFDQASNPDGAILTLGGSQVQGGIPTPYYIPAGGSKQAVVTVERGPQAFDYNNLQFTLFSGCNDGQIRDTVFLDAHFKNACSPIKLSKPLQGWALGSSQNHKMRVRVDNYNKDLLNNIIIQIANKDAHNWQTLVYLDKDDLGDNSKEANAILEQFEDGFYDLRAVLECGSGKVYSDVVSGRIDRNGPELFGRPEPTDLLLDSTDVISANFTEPLNCYKLSDANVVVKNISNGVIYPASLGCNGDRIIIIPDFGNYTFSNDTFNVRLNGLEDMYGNAMEEEISWSFIAEGQKKFRSDDDTDKDGILNAADNCPYAYNPSQADSDNDGIGDICDDDLDGDNVSNDVDNCLRAYNPNQEDTNNDGVGDVCQQFTDLQEVNLGDGFYIYRNYPNPFNSVTHIEYTLPVKAHVRINVYDVAGHLVETIEQGQMAPGSYKVSWNGTSFASGVYYFEFKAESEDGKHFAGQTFKMLRTQ